jgi:YVTN family beta-propeller protein
MRSRTIGTALVIGTMLAGHVGAGQVPSTASAPDVAVGPRDRVYVAEQFSNTVSVIDPAHNRLVGQIRLGEPQPTNLTPLYKGQLLVHGLGFSPDHRTLAVVSVGSNSVTMIDTATNAVKRTVYVGRSPHEAFFTPDGRELWVTVRGEDYVQVLDGTTYAEKTRITLAPGPGMQIFSPDGTYGFVCSSFTPELAVVDVKSHTRVATVAQASAFCPNVAVTPEGDQVWLTLKDVGRVMVIDGAPPFAVRKVLDTGPITNHVNLVRNEHGRFAYVTVGGLNEVQVYRTDTFERVVTIAVGLLPHGLWPSGDGTRVYVANENADTVSVIDTLATKVVATIPIGQAAQALVYVPDALPQGGDGTQNLQPLGVAGQSTQLRLGPVGKPLVSTAALFDQGITQVLQVSATDLVPKQQFLLVLTEGAHGEGGRELLARFTSNPAGAAIVNAVGPIRQLVSPDVEVGRRWLAIFDADARGAPQNLVQIQQ